MERTPSHHYRNICQQMGQTHRKYILYITLCGCVVPTTLSRVSSRFKYFVGFFFVFFSFRISFLLSLCEVSKTGVTCVHFFCERVIKCICIKTNKRKNNTKKAHPRTRTVKHTRTRERREITTHQLVHRFSFKAKGIEKTETADISCFLKSSHLL